MNKTFRYNNKLNGIYHLGILVDDITAVVSISVLGFYVIIILKFDAANNSSNFK